MSERDEVFDIEVVSLIQGVSLDSTKVLVETFDADCIEIGYGMSESGNCYNQPFSLKRRYALLGRSKDEHVRFLDQTILDLKSENESLKRESQHMEARISKLSKENDLLKEQSERDKKLHAEVCVNHKKNLNVLQRMESDLAKVREAIGTREFNKIVGDDNG